MTLSNWEGMGTRLKSIIANDTRSLTIEEWEPGFFLFGFYSLSQFTRISTIFLLDPLKDRPSTPGSKDSQEIFFAAWLPNFEIKMP